MSWQEFSDQTAWNTFVTGHPNSSFLQSFEFGQFNAALGRKAWFLAEKKASPTGLCLLVKQETKLGSFLYSPGGPLVSSEDSWNSLITIVTQLASEEKVNFVRFDPRQVEPTLASKLQDLGLKEIKNFTQPECSQVLDLTVSLDEIRHGFSESTRYNIGWVARQGVKVKVSDKPEDIEIFENLLAQTSARQGFRLNNQPDYYRKQFAVFSRSGLAKLYLTYEPEEDGNDVLAAAIVINFGEVTTYLHAASSSKNPKLRAPYLMQWQIIEDAKTSGAKTYDFWGIAASDSKKDPWAGVTQFKSGFGGKKVYYQGPYDLALNRAYYLDKVLEKARLLVRRFR